MTTAESGPDFVSAPEDYTAFFRMYYPYVVALVRRMGITDDRKEDVASEILLRFLERDFLHEFDPSLVFEYDGQKRPARFKSYLSKFVVTYVRGHFDRQQRLRSREWLICDMPYHDRSFSGEYGSNTWIDVHGGVTDFEDEVLNGLAEEKLVAQLRDHLATVPRRSKHDTCDLPRLFDEVVRQIRRDGEWNVNELKDIFAVSATAMHTWVWWLRENLAEALDRPCPTKRPRAARAQA